MSITPPLRQVPDQHAQKSSGSAPFRKNREYLSFIDGLRCVAVIIVLLYHLGIPLITGGFVGVDIFFVISGFLITGICLDSKFTYSGFYLSRTRRIIPAYIVVIVLTVVAASCILLPPDLRQTSKTVIFSSVFIQNFYFWLEINYFVSGENNPLLHTWSLAVEWQFYMVLPLIIVSIRSRARLLYGVIAALFIISFAASALAAYLKPQADFYLTPFRMCEFLVGSAVVLLAKPRLRLALGRLLGLVGLGLILVGTFLFDRNTIFPGAAAMVPCFGAALIILVGSNSKEDWTARLLSQPPLRLIGRASYSIYLVHWPIIVFGKYLFLDSSPLWPWGAAILSLLLGIGLWRFVEVPFRSWRPVRSKPVIQGALAAMGVTLALGVAGAATDGLPGRFSGRVNWLADQMDEQGRFRHCLGSYAAELGGFCRVGRVGATPQFIVWGDSYADALLEGIDHKADADGVSGIFIGTDACPPLDGFPGLFQPTRRRCKIIQQKALEVLGAGEIKNVIIAANWPLYRHFDASLFSERLTQTMSLLGQRGLKGTLVGVIPGATADVPRSMARAAAFNTTVDLSIGDALRQDYTSIDTSLNDAAVKDSFIFARPSQVLCVEKCIYALDGRPLYFDSGHLAPLGSRLLADHLITW